MKPFNPTEHRLLDLAVTLANAKQDRGIREHCMILHGEHWHREWAERKAREQGSA